MIEQIVSTWLHTDTSPTIDFPTRASTPITVFFSCLARCQRLAVWAGSRLFAISRETLLRTLLRVRRRWSIVFFLDPLSFQVIAIKWIVVVTEPLETAGTSQQPFLFTSSLHIYLLVRIRFWSPSQVIGTFWIPMGERSRHSFRATVNRDTILILIPSIFSETLPNTVWRIIFQQAIRLFLIAISPIVIDRSRR